MPNLKTTSLEPVLGFDFIFWDLSACTARSGRRAARTGLFFVPKLRDWVL